MFITNASIGYKESGVLDSIPAEEIYTEDPVGMALEMATENTRNLNNIFSSIAMAEVVAASNGQDPVSIYTEASVSGFFGKIKEFLMKIWQKIKSIFAKLMTRFDQLWKNGKEFWDKYNKTISKKISDVDFDKLDLKGYKFDKDKITRVPTTENLGITDIASVNSDTAVKSLLGKGSVNDIKDEDMDDIADTIRGKVFGLFTTGTAGSETYDQKEFQKELFEAYRGGESSKEKMESSDVTFSILQDWLTNKDYTTTLKKTHDKLKRDLDKAMTNAQKQQSELTKDKGGTSQFTQKTSGNYDKDKSVTGGGRVISIINHIINAVVTAQGAQAKAAADAISQYKAFAAAILRAPARSGSNYKIGESTVMNGGYSGGDIFGRVVLH